MEAGSDNRPGASTGRAEIGDDVAAWAGRAVAGLGGTFAVNCL